MALLKNPPPPLFPHPFSCSLVPRARKKKKETTKRKQSSPLLALLTGAPATRVHRRRGPAQETRRAQRRKVTRSGIPRVLRVEGWRRRSPRGLV